MCVVRVLAIRAAMETEVRRLVRSGEEPLGEVLWWTKDAG